MGLLSGTSCYLAGPAEKSEDPFGWRRDIAEALTSIDIKVIDPLVKPKWLSTDLKVSPSAYKTQYAEHDSTGLSSQDRIRVLCRRMVAVSDWMIVRMDNGPTVGTIEEMIDAKNQNKPVFLVCPDDQVSMWALNLVADDMKDAHKYHFRSMKDLWVNIVRLNEMKLDDIIKSEDDAFKWLFLTYWYQLKEE